jgi:dipeptidyl aminopeptidase/acylaminoacyl peptidase
MQENKVYFENSKNQKLCGILYIPEGDGPFPIVIVCHGLSSSKKSTNTTMVYPELIKNNIALFAIDFSGHGESEGKFEDVTISQAIDDLESALKYVKDNSLFDNERISLLGSSFGGITSIMVASKHPEIKALAIKAPIIDFGGKYSRTANIDEWKNRGYKIYHSTIHGEMKLEYSYYEDGTKYNGFDAIDKIKMPTIVIVGDKDITVFTEVVKEFYDSLKCEKEFHLIRGANHWFTDKQRKELFGYIINWFKKYLTT